MHWTKERLNQFWWFPISSAMQQNSELSMFGWILEYSDTKICLRLELLR